MTSRQQDIIKTIVEEYVRTTEPVGSKTMVELFGVSSATLRNDMAGLCKEGYLEQPHTSAGRVPTEKGYQYYLENLIKLDLGAHQIIDRFKGLIGPNLNSIVHQLSKALTELSEEAVVVGLGRDVSYYTGITNLFSKPEFRELDTVLELSEVLDRFGDVLGDVFDTVDRGVSVRIGSQNPFHPTMSSVFVKCSAGNCLIGIIGSTRMDYAKNIALMNEIKTIFDSLYGER